MGVMGPLVASDAIVEHLRPGRRLFRYLEFAAFSLVLTGLTQRIVGFPHLFTNPNGIAGCGVAALPIFLFRWDDVHHKKWAALSVLVSVMGIVASGSRGGAAAALCTLLVYFGLRRSANWRTVVALAFVAAVTGALLLWISAEAVEFAYKGGETLLDAARQNQYSETMEAFRKRPLFGYGFGLSWNVQRRHVADALSTGRLSWFVGEFGNSTLAILSGGGLALVLAFGALLARTFDFSYRSLASLIGLRRRFQLAMIAGLAGMVVHSQSEAWLMAPLNWITIVFWLYVGLAVFTAGVARPSSLRRAHLSKAGSK
jgi:O-antigen ligase